MGREHTSTFVGPANQPAGALNGGRDPATGADTPAALGSLLLGEVYTLVRDAVIILGPTSEVVAANPAADTLMRVRPGGLVGLPLVKLLPVSAPLLEFLAVPDKQDPLELEVNLARPGGGLVKASVSAWRLPDGHTLLLCHPQQARALDLDTPRVERRYKAILEHSGDILFVLDAHERVDFVSSAAAQLGLMAGVHRESDLWALVHPKDRNRAMSALAPLHAQKLEPTSEVTFTVRVRLKGAWVWFEVRATDLSNDPDVRGVLVRAQESSALMTELLRLRRSEAHYRAVAEQTDTKVALLDSRRRLARMLDRQPRELGYEEGQLLGSRNLELVHPDDQGKLSDAFDLVEAQPGATEAVRLRVRDARGDYQWVEGALTNLLHDPTVGAYLVSYRLVRERAPAAEQAYASTQELKRRLTHLQSLRRIDMAINNSVDVKLVFDIFMSQIVQDLSIDAVAVLFSEPQQVLRPAMGLGFTSELRVRARVPFGEGPAGRAAGQQLWVFLPELRGDEGWGAAVEPEQQVEFSSYMAVPMVAKGQVQGVLELYSKRRLEPSEEWLEFLETYADQGAIAIENSQLFRSLERSNQELHLAYDRTIEGWANALDLKDEETAGHSKRVTDLTVRLAYRLGVPTDEMVHIQRGALLHDIGKMGIPDNILLKRGSLTPEEFELMKLHPDYAYELLSPIEFLRPALDIPYCHHERWDGSGYPRGLQGAQIPLAARVFAVVDVYDALTSDRPYRDAWPQERALQYIREGAGTQFDPRVVDAFFEMLEHEGLDGRPV